MPLLIRGMFFEGWSPTRSHDPDRSAEGFITRIESQVGDVMEWRGPRDVEAVFHLLNARISTGEIANVKANLPRHIRDLWPD
jgi:uncharacterized protein (DUF2267 family)